MNNVLNNSVTDSTDIALDLVNEIVHLKAHRNQRPTPVVVLTAFEERTEKFSWLILNNIKEQTTISCKVCQERETH